MYALIYLDDVIVYSKTEDEHLVCLHTVLERFMENGLKLKLPNVISSTRRSTTWGTKYLWPEWNRALKV